MKLNTVKEQVELILAECEGKNIQGLTNDGYEFNKDLKGYWRFQDTRYRVKAKTWIPKGCGVTLDHKGRPNIDKNIGSSSFGTTFNTIQDAEEASKEYRKYHRLWRLANELNGDWTPDWKANDSKYYIVVNNSKNSDSILVSSCTFVKNAFVVYFKSQNLAREAIDLLKDELL